MGFFCTDVILFLQLVRNNVKQNCNVQRWRILHNMATIPKWVYGNVSVITKKYEYFICLIRVTNIRKQTII